MAYVNVAEWSPEQVCDWIRGLEDSLSCYIDEFLECKVTGRRLLQLAPDLLPCLGVVKIGHQELLLQAIRQLRNIHYHLDQETLQNLALRLSSKARSIYNELKPSSIGSVQNGGGSAGEDDGNSTDEDDHTEKNGSSSSGSKRPKLVSTEIVAGVADCLLSVKTVVSWLSRSPFEGVEIYDKLKSEFVELGIRLATISQRDLFAEDQAAVIRDNCFTLSEMADNIIQNSKDPLIIQPASLDVATIKKKPDDDLGLHLVSSYDGVHQVSIIRPLSPAHTCAKLSEGDHLIQVNYQTVIGWLPEKVESMIYENPIEVILTVKKQPRHAPGATQIYFKPFRLPSKKRSYNHGYSTTNEYSYRNNFTNLNLYSLLDGSHYLHSSKLVSPQKVSSTLPKPPQPKPIPSPEQRNHSARSSNVPSDSPEKISLRRVASPSNSIEGRQSSVSFAVSDEEIVALTADTTATAAPSSCLSPDTTTSSSSSGGFITAPSDTIYDTVATPPPSAREGGSGVGASSPLHSLHNTSDVLMPSDEEDDDAFLSSSDDMGVDNDEDDAASTSASVRLYPPKPRAPVHRRATIPGDSAPALTASSSINQYIESLRLSGMALRSVSRSGAANTSQSSMDKDYLYLRSNASPDVRGRPHTTIGPSKYLGEGKGGHPTLSRGGPQSLPSAGSGQAGSQDGAPTLPPKGPSSSSRQRLSVTTSLSPSTSTSSPSPHHHPVPLTITSPPTPVTPQPPSTPHTPSSGLMSGRRVSEDRPKLDKSHSTPAYDFGADGAPVTAQGTLPPPGVFFATSTNTSALVPPKLSSGAPDKDKPSSLRLEIPSTDPSKPVPSPSSSESTPVVTSPAAGHIPDTSDYCSRGMTLGKLKDMPTFYCDEENFGDSVFYIKREDENTLGMNLNPSTRTSTSTLVEVTPDSVTQTLSVPSPDGLKSTPLLERRTPGASRPGNLDIKGATQIDTKPVEVEKTSPENPVKKNEETVHVEHDSDTAKILPIKSQVVSSTSSDPIMTRSISQSPLKVDIERTGHVSLPIVPSDTKSREAKSVSFIPMADPTPMSQKRPNQSLSDDSLSKTVAACAFSLQSKWEKSMARRSDPLYQEDKRRSLLKSIRPATSSREKESTSSSSSYSVRQCSSSSSMFDVVASFTSRFYSSSSTTSAPSMEEDCQESETPTILSGVAKKPVCGASLSVGPGVTSSTPSQYGVSTSTEAPPANQSSSRLVTLRPKARRCASASPSLWRRGVMLAFRPSQTIQKLAQGGRSSVCGVCAGGRGVACRDLGTGDHQGWLYRRSRNASTFLHSHHWDKRWFILKKGYLYGYSSCDAAKAESLIYLPGFHVCPAQDAKTKKFAFKIYHANGATFFFACDTGEERSRWMSEMGLSALSTGRCSEQGGNSPSPPPQHTHQEEAYYSETDEEQEPETTTGAPPKSDKDTSGGGFSSLFHWGSGTSSTGRTLSSLVSSKAPPSATGGSGGMKFLQLKQVQAVPSANFRSYRRVRDSGRSTSTTDLRMPPSQTPTTAPPPPKPSVSRKGSLREKLRNHLPAALSLDRKRRTTKREETCAPSKPDASKNKENLEQAPLESKVEEDFAPTAEQMLGAVNGSAVTEETNKPESDNSNKRLSSGSGDSNCTPITPLKCKLISTPHRGSLDCLSSTNQTASSYGFKSEASHKSWMCTLRSSHNDGLPINRPSPVTRTASGNNTFNSSSPNTPRTPGRDSSCSFSGLNKSLSSTFSNGSDTLPSSIERLKRTGNYRPVNLKGSGGEPMKTAFVMGLDDKKESVVSKSASFLNSSCSVRPQVPPRTKFLSPSERNLSQSTPPTAVLGSSVELKAAFFGGSALAKAGGPDTNEEQDPPKTPFKPTMGISMIGKQRRTPGVLSPREVFFCSPPPSPSPITPHQHIYHPHTTLASTTPPAPVPHHSTPTTSRLVTTGVEQQTLSNSACGFNAFNAVAALNRSATGQPSGTSCQQTAPLQVLPHYPNMEYPPIFEAGSYTIPNTSMRSYSQSTTPTHLLHSTPLYNPPPTHSTSTPSFSQQSTSTEVVDKTASEDSSSNTSASTPQKKPWASTRPPIPNPRTPVSEAQYCNLQGLNSVSLPVLSESPPSGSGVVGISCTGAMSVVSHHHSIYVTSPVKRPPLPHEAPPLPRRSSCDSPNLHGSAESLLTRGTNLSPSSIHREAGGGSPKVGAPRRTPPQYSHSTPPQHPHSTPPQYSHSNSSLDSISEHGTPLGSSVHRSSGGSATLITPKPDTATHESFYQHGGSSGGTVTLSTQGGNRGTLPPPRLVLPGPPSEPPPP